MAAKHQAQSQALSSLLPSHPAIHPAGNVASTLPVQSLLLSHPNLGGSGGGKTESRERGEQGWKSGEKGKEGLKKAASQTSSIPFPQQRPRAQARTSIRGASVTRHTVAQAKPQTCCHLSGGCAHAHWSAVRKARRQENPPTSSPWASPL